MSEKIRHSLVGVSETLLIPLYIRACKSQHPDGMIRDDLTVREVEALKLITE